MRAVLDPNVIISAMLSPSGAPARVVQAWTHGGFEMIVSPLLLAELERALAYPKLRKRIDPEEAQALVRWLGGYATVAADPLEPPTIASLDPNDDYLIALAAAELAALVSGDRHLLELSDRLPVYSPSRFLDILSASGGDGFDTPVA